jgi:CubicO group peptidase (beta-lactamase class C family)
VEPGTKWAYCNNGYALLGEIVARAEGRDLASLLRRRVFEPLEMRDTHIDDTPHVRLSTGYHRAPGEDTRFQLERAGIEVRDEPTVDGLNIRGKFTADFNRAMRAAGGVQSTLHDMARYASALLRRGSGIVRAETFEAMVDPQVCPHPRLVNWGLSFSRTPANGRTLIGHGGAYFGGWNSNLSILPDEGIGVIQHMNIMVDRPAPVFAGIRRAVLDQPEPVHASRPAAAPVIASAPGIYRLPMPGPLTNFRPATRVGPIEITADGDALVMKTRWGDFKGGVRLVPVDGADPYFFAAPRGDGDAMYVAFTRDASGAVDGLRCDELVYMPRVPA